MWMQGVLVFLLSGLSAPGRAQPLRCRVGEQLPASAPQDLGPPEAALLRDVSGLLRFIRAQLRQLARTERGGAPLLPPRGPPAPHHLLAGLEIGLCSQSQDPQPMALLEGKEAAGRRHLGVRTRPAGGGRGRVEAPPPPRGSCRNCRAAARGSRCGAGPRWRPPVRFLLGSAPDKAPPSPEPLAPRAPPGTGVAEAGRATTGFREAAGDLATPELHTSLALGEEVRVATHQGFDAHRAAQELLVTSFLARCSVEGKAAAGMNIPREQQLYQGLVSLQVPAEEVLSCALQEKLSLVRSQPEPRREPVPEGPDLLMFYEPQELVAETPYLGVEGLPPLRLQPQIRPPASTFLMFRKLQQWEA
nr:protein phosphatase 1 regulatory subunit 35 [Chrysemys picta bellii]